MNETFTAEPSILIITCSSGISPYLAKEVQELGFPVHRTSETTVETEGTLEDCMRLNMYLRTAHRVLYTLDRFRARDPRQLYNNVYEIPWERYIDPDGYISIDKAVETETISDTRFASLKTKDAIVDRMRDKFGKRPNSGNSREETCLFLHWVGDHATIYIDTTGESLSFRNYREITAEAPMRESLAAAIIMASGWDYKSPFLNPMCGCGTIAIEAAWMAQNRAPALLRENFAFMHLTCYEPTLWTKVRAEAIRKYEESKNIDVQFVVSDIDRNMIDATRRNAIIADVAQFFTFDVCDFMLSPVPETAERGTIIMNPPYGGRIGDPLRLRDLYCGMGIFLSQNSESYNGFLFTGNPELSMNSGLQAEHSETFYNARIECELLSGVTITPEAVAGFNRRNAIR